MSPDPREFDAPASGLAVLPPAEAGRPLVADAMRRLEDSGLAPSHVGVHADELTPESVWQLEVHLPPREDEGEARVFRLWLEPALELDDFHFQWAGVREEDEEAARQAPWAVFCECDFGETPLEDFHDQLRLLAAAVPDAVLLLDLSACRTHPGAWLRDAAESEVPPRPESLYCIHLVRPDEQDGPIWLHTHGLLRCGSLELEMLDVPEDAVDPLAGLINALAPIWIEQGPFPPREPCAVGRGLALAWLPWPDALKKQRRLSNGGAKDRDESHSVPSAVLYAPRRRFFGLLGTALRNPAVLAEEVTEGAVHFVSNMESKRMAQLARERLPRLRPLVERFGGDEDWLFLLKLGYEVDDGEGEREHLWFEVHELEEDAVDATCINTPIAVAALSEGLRGRHELSRLSDWMVLCEHGRFGPDEIVHLERALEAGD